MIKQISSSLIALFYLSSLSIQAQVGPSLFQNREEPRIHHQQRAHAILLTTLIGERLEEMTNSEGLSLFVLSWGAFISSDIYQDFKWDDDNTADDFASSNLDASAIYGSNEQQADWLRTFEGGKLELVNTADLPYDALDDLINPGLLALHRLFVNEHNRICDQLHIGGYTDDEEMYTRARRRVAAMIQNITYQEFLPAIGITIPNYAGHQVADVENTSQKIVLTELFTNLRDGDDLYFENDPALDERLKDDLRAIGINDVLAKHPNLQALFTDFFQPSVLETAYKASVDEDIYSISPATIDIYPNPSSGPLSIRVNSSGIEEARLKITDMQGRIVYPIIDVDLDDDFHLEELSMNLSAGTYLINFISSHYVETRQLIIQAY